MPAISVVIPIYNSEKYISACLQSLMSQSFSDFEAICVNDASPDNAFMVARTLCINDNRFVFIDLEENKGPSVARNVALDHATGDYIAFLDSDDQLTPDAFNTLYSLAQANKLDLVDFCGEPLYESEKIKNIWHEAIDKRTPLEGIVSGPDLFIHYQRYREYRCALYLHFFKRKLLEENGTPLRLKEGIIHEDEIFSPYLHARAKRTMLIQDRLYKRLVHEGSLVTTPRGIFNVSCLFNVTQELEGWLQEHARDYSGEFVDAFALRIWELRKILAEDILRCSPEEIVAFEESLSSAELANFNIHDIQLAANMEILFRRKSWRIAQNISRAATKAREIARL